MTNFIELASHLADPPSEQTPNPFAKYRAAFRRLHTVFSGPLPSPESTLMHGVGLPQHMSPKWSVDDASVRSQVQIIAEAESLEAVRKAGIDPSHYKKLREIDAKSFLGLVAQARRDIRDPRIDLEAGGKLLHRFLGYLIFRASSEAVVLHQLPSDQQIAAIHFFERAGGRMFLAHFIKLLQRMIRDGANDDPNDFYDMLQLLLLRDINLLFVTDDRPFFQYYAGSEHHRVVPWKAFKDS